MTRIARFEYDSAIHRLSALDLRLPALAARAAMQLNIFELSRTHSSSRNRSFDAVERIQILLDNPPKDEASAALEFVDPTTVSVLLLTFARQGIQLDSEADLWPRLAEFSRLLGSNQRGHLSSEDCGRCEAFLLALSICAEEDQEPLKRSKQQCYRVL